VAGTNFEAMLREVNLILEQQQLTLQNIHVASANGQARMVFTVDSRRDEQNILAIRLHESNLFATVATIGTTEHE
jgi:hypothetical protein